MEASPDLNIELIHNSLNFMNEHAIYTLWILILNKIYVNYKKGDLTDLVRKNEIARWN